MPTLTINQQRIFYTYQDGSDDKPALLLVHGAGGRHIDWPSKVRHLPNIRVVALDLPGHAQSDQPGRTSIDAYADDVQAVIEKLALEKVVVAGHSMGGAITQSLALRGLPQLSGIILLSTGAKLRVSPAILDNIVPNFNTAINIITQYAWSKNARPVLVGLSKRLMAETAPQVLHGDFSACNAFELTGRLQYIHLPTLVLVGSADRMTPPKYNRYLADEIPQAKYIEIDGAGHFVAQEKPDRVASEIAQFLTEISMKGN